MTIEDKAQNLIQHVFEEEEEIESMAVINKQGRLIAFQSRLAHVQSEILSEAVQSFDRLLNDHPALFGDSNVQHFMLRGEKGWFMIMKSPKSRNPFLAITAGPRANLDQVITILQEGIQSL